MSSVNRLYGVMNNLDRDQVFTYEARSELAAATLYLDDPECIGDVVRVWELDRTPSAFVKATGGEVLALQPQPPVTA